MGLIDGGVLRSVVEIELFSPLVDEAGFSDRVLLVQGTIKEACTHICLYVG